LPHHRIALPPAAEGVQEPGDAVGKLHRRRHLASIDRQVERAAQVGQLAQRDRAGLVGVLGVGVVQEISKPIISAPVTIFQGSAPGSRKQGSQVGHQCGVEAQEGKRDPRQRLGSRQRGLLQFSAGVLPQVFVHLGDAQNRPTLKHRQVGQGGAGLGAQAV
jgi:hypothetical protein